jgi:4-hydroxybenzoate polyprenyltransferase
MFQVVIPFIKKLRISDPWKYKAPVLVGIVYLSVIICKIEFWATIKYYLLSLTTIIGISGYAYLLNDWIDEKADVLTGKKNSVIGLTMPFRFFWLTFFLVVAIFPWFYFPYNGINLCLLLAELLLFIFYSAKPFRFKEKPILGVLTDALYAHVIPAVLAALTFHEVSRKNSSAHDGLINNGFESLIMCMAFWQFFLGVRNILLHQLEDYPNDKLTQTTTFVLKFGVLKTEKLLRNYFIPMEFICWAVFLIVLTPQVYFLSVSYIAFILLKVKYNYNNVNGYRNFCYWFMDDFYQYWFAVTFIAQLVLMDWRFIILMAIHLLIFRNGLTNSIREFVA